MSDEDRFPRFFFYAFLNLLMLNRSVRESAEAFAFLGYEEVYFLLAMFSMGILGQCSGGQSLGFYASTV